MKRLIFACIALFLLLDSAFCQTQSFSNGEQTFSLVGAELDNEHTYVIFDVSMRNKRSGWFSFGSSNYIQCGNRKISPTHYYVGTEYISIDSRYTYERGYSGRTYRCKLVFPRIPVGYSSIRVVAPGAWDWRVDIKNNQSSIRRTKWTTASLKQHFLSNSVLKPLEGIYDFLSSDSNAYEYNLSIGIIRNDSGYDVVFLSSPRHEQWKEGELKATIQATGTLGLFKVSNWYLANKTSSKDFYATIDDGAFVLLDNNDTKTTYFVKTFPTVEDNTTTSGAGTSSGQEKQYLASGTGFFIDPLGFIATNYHVIDGAKGIDVFITQKGKTDTYTAKSIVVDKSNDLAIIKVTDDSYSKLPPIPYMISSGTKDVGTAVFAMGYPELSHLGEEIKVTDGIISSKTGYQGDITTYQISAPIQHGNSGGPLFDKNGNVIGITNAGVESLQNVGYAIKVSYLNNLIEACPESINTSSSNQISGLSFPDKIKKISPYVVIIKVY